jgi:predicted AAA+ superfamily ATPase
LLFKNISEKSVFAKLRRAISLDGVTGDETRDLIYDAAAEMIALAEKNSISGDLWEIFYAIAAAEDDNPISAVFERAGDEARAAFAILAEDLWMNRKIIAEARSRVNDDDSYADLRGIRDYVPVKSAGFARPNPAYREAAALAGRFAAARSAPDMAAALKNFSARRGCGVFALNDAFTWNSAAKKLVPIADADPVTLDSMLGYETQKAELRANTESFLSGKPSNNVLLFGDSGTGKSTSVRALLNEPGFCERGLRMIELRHDQFAEIPDLLAVIRGRNYRFILFMDDLSFEEFEVGYKHLKALIEGGLERKPGNVIIYATSNRRNIIREVWADRAASVDDVHGWDTMQEKHSLSDRFGVTIWYPSVNKSEYLSIVKSIAEEMGLEMDAEEMETLAMRWELDKGGFTGRTARQFVCRMLRDKI